MINERFLKAKENVQPEHRIFVKKNLAIIEQIFEILEEKHWTQKQLATALGKSESEISKWMSGTHNLTLQTISKIEAVLQTEILITSKQATERWISFKVPANNEIYGEYSAFSMHLASNSNLFGSLVQKQMTDLKPKTNDFHAKWAQVTQHFTPPSKSNTDATEENSIIAA